MKKGIEIFALFGLFLVILVFSLQFASAALSAREVSEKTIQAFIDAFEPVLTVLFGGTSGSGLILFEKLLVFIIFVSLVYLSIGQIDVFSDNKRIRLLISVVVPLIGIRFLDYNWMMAIVLQYKILAIAMTGLLPFILFFFFVHKTAGEHAIIRKIAWIFFIVVYFGLWANSEIEQADIYLWTMIGAFVFLLLDRTIHRYMLRQEMQEANSANKWEHIAKLRRDIQEINNSMQAGHISDRIGRKIIRRKEKQIQWYLRSSSV